MDPEDLLGRIDQLKDSTPQLTEAISFLRLVLQNNPTKTARELLDRPDVREAVSDIDSWLSRAETLADEVISALPDAVEVDLTTDLARTFDKLETDTDFEHNETLWRTDNSDREVSRLVLRLIWLLEWLAKMVAWSILKTPYKRWVSRLATNTCRYCRAMHGAVIPVGASFAVVAAQAGWTRTYGGLYAPPLHPRCQCWLEGVTAAEYRALADTSGESRVA